MSFLPRALTTARAKLGQLFARARETPPGGTLLSAVTLTATLALVALTILVPVVRWYATGVWHWLPPAPAVPPAPLEIMKLAGTFVAGLGGMVALTVSYRRQREQELRRDSLRFDAAAHQLGSEDGANRLAGVYAAAALADESIRIRPAVVQLLCAYLRLNRPSDGPVQQTILEAIAERTRDSAGSRSWSPYDFDLHGITVGDRLQWSGCRFDGAMDLEGVTFQRDVNLIMARFTDSVILNGARFESDCTAFWATFSGTVLMNRARFEHGINALEASFTRGLQANGAAFLEYAGFSKSRFTNGAVFSGATFALAGFDECLFARGEPGRQTDAVHNGDAHFLQAEFNEGSTFDGAIFASRAVFDGAKFGKGTRFDGVRFLDGGSVQGAIGSIPKVFRTL